MGLGFWVFLGFLGVLGFFWGLEGLGGFKLFGSLEIFGLCSLGSRLRLEFWSFRRVLKGSDRRLMGYVGGGR